MQSMIDTADIAIIGAGAAGLAAAIFAAEKSAETNAARPLQIVLLEGSSQPGTKILVSGGGRCNVTHDVVTPDDYSGSKNIVRNVLSAFDAAATVAWFASLGVELKLEEDGKLFPVSDSARTVLEALTTRCRELGVHLRASHRVTSIAAPTQMHPTYRIEHIHGTLAAGRVIVATGGQSLPRSGTDGSGWELVRELGHTVTPTHQALVPLMLESNFFHAQLSGIAQDVELTTFADGKLADRRTGAVLWTHFGISGPGAMDASRFWTMAHDQSRQPKMFANFIAPDTFESAEKWLIGLASSRAKAQIITLLSTRLTERLARTLLAYSHIPPTTLCGQLPRDSRRALVHALTALPLPITGPRGWNYAEVTAGGVPLSEINFRTMESRKLPGLYLVGEMLDCDGRIGGFNFQWAWATGHLAGRAAAVAPR